MNEIVEENEMNCQKQKERTEKYAKIQWDVRNYYLD